jgi:WD40 repeat protein
VAVAAGTGNVALWLLPDRHTAHALRPNSLSASHSPPPEPVFVASLATSTAASYHAAGPAVALVTSSRPSDNSGEVDALVRAADAATGYCRFLACGTMGGTFCLWQITHGSDDVSPTVTTIARDANAHSCRIGHVAAFSRRATTGSETAMSIGIVATAGDDGFVCLWLVEGQTDYYGLDMLKQLPAQLVAADAWHGQLRVATTHYVRLARRVTIPGASVPRHLEAIAGGHAMLLFCGKQVLAVPLDPADLYAVDGLQHLDAEDDEVDAAPQLVASLPSDITAVTESSSWQSSRPRGGTPLSARWDVAVGCESGHVVAITAAVKTLATVTGGDQGVHTQTEQVTTMSFGVVRRAKGEDTRHAGHVSSLALSPVDVAMNEAPATALPPGHQSRRLLLSASFDCSVQVRRFPNLSLVSRVRAHTDAVRSGTFHPEVAAFATCGTDGVLKVWRVDGQLLTSLRRIAAADSTFQAQRRARRPRDHLAAVRERGTVSSPPHLQRDYFRSLSPPRGRRPSNRVTSEAPSSPMRGRSTSPSVTTHRAGSPTADRTRFMPATQYSRVLWCNDATSLLTLEEVHGSIRRVGVAHATLAACPTWPELSVSANPDRSQSVRNAPPVSAAVQHETPPPTHRHYFNDPEQQQQQPPHAGELLHPTAHPRKREHRPPRDSSSILQRKGYKVVHHLQPMPSDKRDDSPRSQSRQSHHAASSAIASSFDAVRTVSPGAAPNVASQRAPSIPAHETLALSVDNAADPTERSALLVFRPPVTSDDTPTTARWVTRVAANRDMLCQVGLGAVDPCSILVVRISPGSPTSATGQEPSSDPQKRLSPPRGLHADQAVSHLVEAAVSEGVRVAALYVGLERASPLRRARFAPPTAPILRAVHAERMRITFTPYTHSAAASADISDATGEHAGFRSTVRDKLEAIAPCMGRPFSPAELADVLEDARQHDTDAGLLLALLPTLALPFDAMSLAGEYPAERIHLWASAHSALFRYSEAPPALTSHSADHAADAAVHGCAFVAGQLSRTDETTTEGAADSGWRSTSPGTIVELQGFGGDPLAPLLAIASLNGVRARLTAFEDPTTNFVAVLALSASSSAISHRRYLSVDDPASTNALIGSVWGCEQFGMIVCFPAGQRFVARGSGSPAVMSYVTDATARSYLLRLIRAGTEVAVFDEVPTASPVTASPPRSRPASPTRSFPVAVSLPSTYAQQAWSLCH